MANTVNRRRTRFRGPNKAQNRAKDGTWDRYEEAGAVAALGAPLSGASTRFALATGQANVSNRKASQTTTKVTMSVSRENAILRCMGRGGLYMSSRPVGDWKQAGLNNSSKVCTSSP
jgi:hypothetical protein